MRTILAGSLIYIPNPKTRMRVLFFFVRLRMLESIVASESHILPHNHLVCGDRVAAVCVAVGGHFQAMSPLLHNVKRGFVLAPPFVCGRDVVSETHAVCVQWPCGSLPCNLHMIMISTLIYARQSRTRNVCARAPTRKP